MLSKPVETYAKYTPPNSSDIRFNRFSCLLTDSWVVNINENQLEILDMLSKTEAQFMLDKSKEELEHNGDRIDYLIREIAREGYQLSELLEKNKSLKGIIQKITKAFENDT